MAVNIGNPIPADSRDILPGDVKYMGKVSPIGAPLGYSSLVEVIPVNDSPTDHLKGSTIASPYNPTPVGATVSRALPVPPSDAEVQPVGDNAPPTLAVITEPPYRKAVILLIIGVLFYAGMRKGAS